MAVRWSGLGPDPGYTFTGVIFISLPHSQAHKHMTTSAQQNVHHIMENFQMNPCCEAQGKPFEVRCAASGEQDYTSKQSAGQSCFTGQ